VKTSLLVVMLAVPAAVLAQQAGGPALPPSGNVAVPLEEYNKLVELAGKPVKTAEAPPVPYAIDRAEFKLRVTGESVTGTLQLEGEIFVKGAVKVPLVAGMTVVDAQVQGRPLPLEQADGTHTAVLTGPGEFAVTLETGIEVRIEPGRASFILPAPWAGAVRMAVVVPGDNTNVGVVPGLVTSRTSSGGETTVEATLTPGQPSMIGWTTAENATPAVPKEVRFLSDVKTLASVSDAQIGIAALVDITVVQGEPARFGLPIPAGYEVTDASGPSLESSEVQAGVLILNVSGVSHRSHQFLVSMEKSIDAPKTEVPILSLKGAQRETGEILVESQGTMELTAKESGGLKRMDLKEVNPSLRSLAQNPLQAAFRYHRQPAEAAGLALDWVRFPDSSVQAAVAERAVVTTLVTSEGRSLTEVRLTVSNQAQPFLKVALPAGASILSADVAGEKVKPVEGPDGGRVPLLRTGFRPSGPYEVSFVFLHSGAPFAKKGGSELTLPKMDVPIGLVQWEVFLPERYQVKNFGGDAISTNLLPPPSASDESVIASAQLESKDAASWPVIGYVNLDLMGPGQLGGYVIDQAGAVVPGARVSVSSQANGAVLNAVADAGGRWMVSNVPSGKVTVTVSAAGFNRSENHIDYDASRPRRVGSTLRVGSVAEQIEVSSSAESIAAPPGRAKIAAAAQKSASANVGNLQQRVAGVLPIAVDVPHAGTSYRFVRPLVLDEETTVTFAYKTK